MRCQLSTIPHYRGVIAQGRYEAFMKFPRKQWPTRLPDQQQVIKLPSGYRVLAKHNSPPEQFYTPSDAASCPFGKTTPNQGPQLFSQDRNHIVLVVALFSWVVAPCSNYNMVILFISIDRRIVRDTCLSPKISYSYCTSGLTFLKLFVFKANEQ